MGRKICVIDGNALMHRAFHAIQTPMNAPDGTPTNAAFGFFTMFCKNVADILPDATICTFDHGKATHRLELYEKYKANRPHMDENLRCQFPIVEEALRAMDVPIVIEEGWEGDDVMGTISRMCRAAGHECYLVTGDKDMNQLVGDGVFTVTTDHKSRNTIIRDCAAVEARFGVKPSQIVDYLALVGDTSDNIPGVPGIGEKSAVEILSKYGSLDELYENLSDFKGKKLENLTNFKEDAYLSQTLATINTGLDLDINLDEVESFNFDEKALSETLMKYGLRSALNSVIRLKSTLFGTDIDAQGEPEVEIPSPIDDDLALTKIMLAIKAKQPIGFSCVEPTKTYAKKNEGTSVTYGVSDGDVCLCVTAKKAAELASEALKNCEVVAYDAKEIIKLAYPLDKSRDTLISEVELFNANVFDVHVAANMDNSAVTFKYQEEYFSQLNPGYDTEVDIEKRAREYSYLALEAKKLLVESLQNQGEALNLFNNVEKRLTCVLSIIERNGAKIDESVMDKTRDYCAGEISELTSKIYELAGHEFNIDSPAQLSIVLFQELGVPSAKKTATGYSTDAKVLSQLADDYEICALVLKYRELAKLKSTYVDALPAMRLTDGLIHTKFNQAATATGRLSSSDPNLQNIPVRKQLGKVIREAFIPLESNQFFMSADYSQIELRLLAHLSGDATLIESFVSGNDLHAQTAARIFGVALDDVTPEMRSRAKAVNFGIVYGQQEFSLSKQLGITRGEARDMIAKYYETHPGVKKYLDEVVARATEDGFATTIFGRRRVIPEIHSRNKNVREFGERTAKNHPMQGSAADIIKIAMNNLERELLERKLKTKILIQVHDELDLSVPGDEVEEVGALVKNIMENVIELKVPLIVDVNTGNNWAEAH